MPAGPAGRGLNVAETTVCKTRPWDDPRATAYIEIDRVTKKFSKAAKREKADA